LKEKLATINELYKLLEAVGLSRDLSDELFTVEEETEAWVIRLSLGTFMDSSVYRAMQRLCELLRGTYTLRPIPTWRIPKQKPAILKQEPDKTGAKTTEKSRPNNAERTALERPTVPVKLPASVAEYVRKHGGSTFIRRVLLEKLAEEAERYETQES